MFCDKLLSKPVNTSGFDPMLASEYSWLVRSKFAGLVVAPIKWRILEKFGVWIRKSAWEIDPIEEMCNFWRPSLIRFVIDVFRDVWNLVSSLAASLPNLLAGSLDWIELTTELTVSVAFVLTRPFGASFGDLLTKPLEHGGLALGTIGASSVFAIILMIGLYKETKLEKQRIKIEVL